MKVTFDECICIRHYEYDRDEEYEEKRGRDWQVTTDLTCREFKLPIEKGGCGGDWNVLQSKLDKLDFVHKGIATRNFVRQFTLADDVVVYGAKVADGILTVDLVREIPEEDKPVEITIK